MGCLKSIIKKIIIIALIVAFFAFGGWAFLKDKINQYKNPPREDFVATETDYANFSEVSGDYQLTRSFNFFGYKKINAKYLPTGQKITIFDLKDENRISVSDFETREIDNKINNILNSLKDSYITFENFEIINRGKFNSKNKQIPYIVFKANVKNIPFKNVVGTIAVYSTQNEKAKNPSTKLILTITDKKAYNPSIIKDFVSALIF
jgi:hypothetical protein